MRSASQSTRERIPSLVFRASSNLFDSVEEMFVNLLEQKVVVAVVDVDSDQNRSWHFECLAEHGTDLVRGMDHVTACAKRLRVLDDVNGAEVHARSALVLSKMS